MIVDLGILVTIALAVVGAWWAIAVIAIKQFEERQDVKFVSLEKNMTEQKNELDTHLQRQDFAMQEIRRVETALAASQLDASNKYQTKIEAGSQHSQVIAEIRNIGARIDALHGIVRMNGQ